MVELTARAERALLGAMIADPELTRGLGYLLGQDFSSQQRQALYYGIALNTTPRDAPEVERYQSIISESARFPGGQHVTSAYLSEIAASCPDPGHGAAYAAMVIHARVHRELIADAALMELQARDLARDARRLTRAGGTGGQRAESLASHKAKVAAAMREHASRLDPDTLGPSGPHPLYLPGYQDQREERVLAALLQGDRETRQVLGFLPVAAFTDWYRQEMFQAIRSLHAARRPVDALTVDWQIAANRARTGGQLISATPVGSADTYATRLARQQIGDEPPLRTASELQARLDHRVKVTKMLATTAGQPAPGLARTGQARPGSRVPPQPGHQANPPEASSPEQRM
jgi:hypothetical protein